MAHPKKSTPDVHINLNVRGLKASATLAINERMRAMIREGKTVYRLGFGQSPFPVPSPVVKTLQEHAAEKDYLEVKGLYPLREAIAGYWKRKQQIDFSADHILIGPGSKELLFLLQLVYYGDLVIPIPSWVSYAPQAQIIGRRVDWLPAPVENDWRLSPEILDRHCSEDPGKPRIVMLNYPANPTGSTYPIERLKLLAEVARRHKLILLSDEIYGDLHHTGQHVSVARYYPEGTIISSGLSKWCGAGGWRLGAFAFPKNLDWLLNAMAVVASETFTATSAPIQYAAVAAFSENPEIEDYLKNARRILRLFGNALHKKLAELGISAPKPEGGFYLFPNFEQHRGLLAGRNIHTSRELCEQLLQDTGIALLPASDFGCAPSILCARLSYVDFDGAGALALANENYADQPLDETYLKKTAGKLLEAVDVLQKWLTGKNNPK